MGARAVRAARIVGVLSRCARSRALLGGPADARQLEAARRLRAGLEELGPTFCKLGQVLSTRPDLLPPAVIEELSTLRDRVPPMPAEEVVAVLSAELGPRWTHRFRRMDAVAFASGTIGQVHRVVLLDGTRAVVKVQRPDAAHLIARDVALLRTVARGLGRAGGRLGMDLPAVVEELGRCLTAELDYRAEADNLERMAKVVSTHPRLAVPTVHRETSTGRVLTMDEVQGVPLAGMPHGHVRTETAQALMSACLHQVLVAGFFHADPHPGNLLWAGDRVWLIDLGMAGTISQEDRRWLLLLLMALWRGDGRFAADVVVSAGGGTRIRDVEGFRRAVSAILDGLDRSRLAGLELGPLMQHVLQVAVRHNVPVPTPLALVGKAFAQLQLTVASLAPELDLLTESRRFLLRDAPRQLLRLGDPSRWLYEAYKLHHHISASRSVGEEGPTSSRSPSDRPAPLWPMAAAVTSAAIAGGVAGAVTGRHRRPG